MYYVFLWMFSSPRCHKMGHCNPLLVSYSKVLTLLFFLVTFMGQTIGLIQYTKRDLVFRPHYFWLLQNSRIALTQFLFTKYKLQSTYVKKANVKVYNTMHLKIYIQGVLFRIVVFWKRVWQQARIEFLMILDVKNVEKAFDFISLVSYLISKIYVKWLICLLLNQVLYK